MKIFYIHSFPTQNKNMSQHEFFKNTVHYQLYICYNNVKKDKNFVNIFKYQVHHLTSSHNVIMQYHHLSSFIIIYHEFLK
jgi:hypothetical protein